jgi:hypothetical protein
MGQGDHFSRCLISAYPFQIKRLQANSLISLKKYPNHQQ